MPGLLASHRATTTASPGTLRTPCGNIGTLRSIDYCGHRNRALTWPRVGHKLCVVTSGAPLLARRSLPRWLLASMYLLSAGLFSGDAAAISAVSVEITMLGPSAVWVRVTQGATVPCDSSDNHRLVQGKFNPGEVIRTTTTDNCVCVQQTYEPFTDVDWSASRPVCRPIECASRGRARRCREAPDPTIRIAIGSKREG